MYRVAALVVCVSYVFAQTAQSPQERLKQAIADQQAGKLDQAIASYRGLLEEYPDVALIRSNLGAALAAKGEYAEAIAEYERALKTQANPQVRLNLALSYYKAADIPSTVRTLEQVRKELPQNMQAVTLLADCYLKLGQDKKVVDLLTPIQAAHPDDASFTYLLGTALVRNGETDKGQIIIDKILRDGDSAQARMLMGTTKFMVRDFSGARDDLQKAVELDPNLPDVYAYYGLALLTTGDQVGAKAAFERELKSDPNNFDANLRMGVLLRQDEDNDIALKYFEHALQVRPGDPGVRYQIAVVELSKGELEQAQRELEALVQEAPNFTEAHVSLATVYFREKRKEDGQKERAIVAKLNAEKQANEPAVKAASP